MRSPDGLSAEAVPLRPEYLAPVTLNTRYALSIGPHSDGLGDVHTPDRKILATQVPGGFWAVKVRPRGEKWVTFAVPRAGTVAVPFLIGEGSTYESVLCAGIGWHNSATVAVIRLDRIVFAGPGNATEETPLPAGTVADG